MKIISQLLIKYCFIQKKISSLNIIKNSLIREKHNLTNLKSIKCTYFLHQISANRALNMVLILLTKFLQNSVHKCLVVYLALLRSWGFFFKRFYFLHWTLLFHVKALKDLLLCQIFLVRSFSFRQLNKTST